jgi:hypothetical protein
MDRESTDKLKIIQKMEQLQVFLRGEYVRLGHPNEDGNMQLSVLINTIQSVRGVMTEGPYSSLETIFQISKTVPKCTRFGCARD